MCRQLDGNKVINLHNNDSGLSVILLFSTIQKESITSFPNLNVLY